jgi:hypothetical protein
MSSTADVDFLAVTSSSGAGLRGSAQRLTLRWKPKRRGQRGLRRRMSVASVSMSRRGRTKGLTRPDGEPVSVPARKDVRSSARQTVVGRMRHVSLDHRRHPGSSPPGPLPRASQVGSEWPHRCVTLHNAVSRGVENILVALVPSRGAGPARVRRRRAPRTSGWLTGRLHNPSGASVGGGRERRHH